MSYSEGNRGTGAQVDDGAADACSDGWAYVTDRSVTFYRRGRRPTPDLVASGQDGLVHCGGLAHAAEVLEIYVLQELHGPTDLAVDRASVQHIDVLAPLAVRVAVTEVVDVPVGLGSIVILDEAPQLLVEVG